MKNQGKNIERTTEYLKKFDRDKLLASLIKKKKPLIFDIGGNNGSSIVEFKKFGIKALSTRLSLRKNA